MYSVKEIFYSLQGEGMRAGDPSVFVRFAGCNLRCTREVHGFDCDTDFAQGQRMTLACLLSGIVEVAGPCRWVVLTGGEPLLQIDRALLDALRAVGYSVALETNGTLKVPPGFDWVAVSPKPNTELVQDRADEVRCVVSAGMPLPSPGIEALHMLLSPAFEGQEMVKENVEHCVRLCLEHPTWRLSLQQHKLMGIR
jgi:organic radical activating enzyme